MRLFTAPRVVTPAAAPAGPAVHAPGWVAVHAGRITGAGRLPDAASPLPPGVPDGTPVTALPAGVLAPGLVDAQINGAFGVDFAAATAADWTRVLRRLPETGATTVVPTFITAPLEDLAAALRRYAALAADLAALPGAARVAGIHVEGPFLAPRRRGAHREDLLLDPTAERVQSLVAAGRGVLCYVTLAPEREHGLDAVRGLVAAGVRVSVGHTDAPEAVVRAAAEAGATMVTHLYNAQRPLHHRDPGAVGAALTDPRLTAGLIVDLHHVAPAAVRVAFAAAPGRIMLVTDAVAAMGMPPGRYVLGGDVLDVAPGRPPLRADGAIAGAAVRMDEAVANTVSCGVDLATAVDAATRVPADAIGRSDLGRLDTGAAADLVWLSDDLTTRATWIGGRLAWRDPACDDDVARLLDDTLDVTTEAPA